MALYSLARGGLVAPCILAVALSIAGRSDAQPPTSFPMGHHVFNFQTGNDVFVEASGWDPVHQDAEGATPQADKDALIAAFAAQGLTIYNVGLPGADEPDDVANTWPFPGAVEIDGADLAAAGFPTISLTGVNGPVYLVDQYSNCNGNGADGCGFIRFGGTDTKVVITRSAIGAIEVKQAGASGVQIWILDSLLDAEGDYPGATGCERCRAGYGGGSFHAMYSEILGGVDSGKVYSEHAFYRNHIHGASKRGPEHSDGLQSSGPAQNVFYVENLIDYLFRTSGRATWTETSFGDAGPVYQYRNLLGGGQEATAVVTKKNAVAPGFWVGKAIYRDNVFFEMPGNASYKNEAFRDPGSIKVDIHASGNVGLTGAPIASLAGFAPPSVEDDAIVSAKVAQMDVWVDEIRAVTGAFPPGPGPDPLPRPEAPMVQD